MRAVQLEDMFVVVVSSILAQIGAQCGQDVECAPSGSGGRSRSPWSPENSALHVASYISGVAGSSYCIDFRFNDSSIEGE